MRFSVCALAPVEFLWNSYVAIVMLNSLSQRKLVAAPAHALKIEYQINYLLQGFYSSYPNNFYSFEWYKQHIPVDFRSLRCLWKALFGHLRAKVKHFHRLRPWDERFICASQLTATVNLPRKEVIQPHLPVRLPCYDFTPVTNPALGRCLQKVSSRTSGVVDSHGVTGGVYKTRERIQRSVLICVY